MPTFEVQPIGRVRSSRTEPIDDHWDEVTGAVELDPAQFTPEALQGLDAFSHVEVVFLMDQVASAEVTTGARHPRGRTDWPRVGIFAQRAKGRPNRLGTSVCRLERIEGLSVHLRGLDAIDGTPVLDLKPWVREFGPRGEVRQPAWMTELMREYWQKPAPASAPASSPAPASGGSPLRKLNVNDLPWIDFALGEKVANAFRDPGRAVGSSRVGLRIQRVPPGKQASRLHRHLFQEELFLVASGTGYLRHGDERVRLVPGDCVSYHAGDATPHTVVNDGAEPLEVLSFGDRASHEVCLYPEDGVAYVEALDREVPLEGERAFNLLHAFDQKR